jgi:hypothetical protein
MCVLTEKKVKSGDVFRVTKEFKKGIDSTICRWDDNVFRLHNLSDWNRIMKYTIKWHVHSIWHNVYDNRAPLIKLQDTFYVFINSCS